MKFLTDLGVSQAVLPPQERPDLLTLRRLGFTGSDQQVLESAAREDSPLLAACFSASSMWAANAATVSASRDTLDHRVHFTPANLVSQFHRSLEAPTTSRILCAIFPDESRFAHHAPLPASLYCADEGAANHMRLAKDHGDAGVEIFVHGRASSDKAGSGPKRFPARQTLEASAAIARLHQLARNRSLFIRQNPLAIDAGAFHNDVVAVGNQNVLFWHEKAFTDPANCRRQIQAAYQQCSGEEPVLIEVREDQVSMVDAVRSYLFNSQIVTLPNNTMALICPAECQQVERVLRFLSTLPERSTPIKAVHFIDVRQSMNNGGGPACLRLRVVLSEAERLAALPTVFLTNTLYTALTDWVHRHYREHMSTADLIDPRLVEESRAALDELTKLLGIGSIYPFQLDSR